MKNKHSNNSQEKYLYLSKFDTSNVIKMEYMFTKCYKLKEIKRNKKIK